jgi:hypothetical protein
MTYEKWQQIKGDIKDKFEVEDEGETRLEEEGGVDIEFIVFNGPLGRMQLEFVRKPVVLDKKTTYSRRIGSNTAVEYVYGEEKTETLKVYKWDDMQNDWTEIDSSMFEK